MFEYKAVWSDGGYHVFVSRSDSLAINYALNFRPRRHDVVKVIRLSLVIYDCKDEEWVIEDV